MLIWHALLFIHDLLNVKECTSLANFINIFRLKFKTGMAGVRVNSDSINKV